ncbi:MAG: hypothetical protein JSR90_18865 [Proteobacteria bacterium]|nr:hypothetical protein [Pseudomonadota bacterium]
MAGGNFLRGVAAVAALGLAACTTPAEWEKPGADRSMTATDMSDCQAFAQRDAMRLYPANMSASATGAAAMMSQQQTDTNRAVAQAGFFESCMRSKGYVRHAAPQPAR